MAEILINITDEEYEYFKRLKYYGYGTMFNGLVERITNGVVLHKGHGELVYREDVCNELRYMDNNGCITRSVNHVIEDIKKGVPTIIEADKINKK